MNTAVARKQNEVEWKPVPVHEDSQLQSLLKTGWTISREEFRKIHLEKGDRKMVHHRQRAR